MASAFNGERPNPRLQRTPLRAPLIRKPLGAAFQSGRGILLKALREGL
jgi:hypothetical protein